MEALVVGAGIHGLTIACELAKSGIKVTIADKQNEILMGTSNGTHNRVNMGYHYPRSKETARECYEGYLHLKRHLPQSLYYPQSSYYLIEKNDSKTSGIEYKEFLDAVGLEYKRTWPDQALLIKENIEASFKVAEPCYDIQILRQYYNNEISTRDIFPLLGFKIESVSIDDNEVVLKSKSGHILKNRFDIIVNATYAATNNIQRLFGCTEKLTNYNFQKTEVVVVKSKRDLPALTVMDGPFITILPYAYCGHKDTYLVYDVVNSINKKIRGDFIPEDFYERAGETNYNKMLLSGSRYYAFMTELTPVASLWATRPIPSDSGKDDYRITRTIKHNNHKCFYSVLEGKFVSAPLMAKKIVSQILNEVE